MCRSQLYNGWTIYFWYELRDSLKGKLRWVDKTERETTVLENLEKNKTKEAALLKLGMKPYYAHAYANTSKSYWRIAGEWGGGELHTQEQSARKP